MKLVADIHLHSHYSRATSKELTLEHLWKWAQIKGVQVVATGDIAHPGWLAELREKLEPAEEGLFRLKPEHTAGVADQVPAACRGAVRFLIGGEISNIYKKHDRTRKVHNIVFAPSFEATARLQTELEKIGNIRSDGRPILGLDSRDLLEIVLQVDPRCHLIPAHIWTPWFSILGSKSGFDSVQECFADLTPHIFAVETGLSSDPPMNWRVSWLDDYTLISSSDAHSPPKLAREATRFDTELSYDALFDALRSGERAGYRGTIEFFPEEGKYHLDGHRKCGVCWQPVTTRAHGGRCSACGKPVTVGVYHRMEELADRPHGARPPCAGPFASLIPLPEALAEMLGVGPNSKRVQGEYRRLVERLGPELTILQDLPAEEIAAAGDEVLAEGIRRMRAGEVRAQSGYDGEYGVIRLFDGAADRSSVVQLGMFAELAEDSSAAAGTVPAAGRHAASSGDATMEGGVAATGAAADTERSAGPSAAVLMVRDAQEDQPAAPEPPDSGDSAAGAVPAGRRRAAPAGDAALDQDLPYQAPQEARAVAPGPSVATDSDSEPGAAAPEAAPAAASGAGSAGDAVREGARPYRAAPEEQAAAPEPPAIVAADVRPGPATVASPARLSEWLGRLNPAQREAATHTGGPLAIVAGPGTGKTRTLTVRIAHLVRGLGVPPASILALTFTNKAADELRERLGELLGAEQAGRISAGTFHQLGADLLREFAAAAGIPPSFAVFDEADRRLLLKQSCPELSVAELRSVLAAISARKNGLATDTAGAPPVPPARPPREGLPDLAVLRDRYDAALAEAGALDLDDLVGRTVRLLETDLVVRRTLQARFRWISVDEYQDVNAAQYRLLRLLAGGGANVCVIGDPDQAIYGFRGADHRYFLAFGDDFPGARRLHLDRNYRSAQGILSAAGQVIARNPDHQATALIADFTAPVKLDVYRAPTDKAEAEYVVHQVERMVGGTSYFSLDSGRVEDDDLTETRAFGEFAVLYRLNAQAKLLEEAFDRSGIPYQITGATALAEQQPVREILSLLWLSQAPVSRIHWWRILSEGRGAPSEQTVTELVTRISAAAGAAGSAGAPLPDGAGIGAPPGARLARTLALVRSLADPAPASVAERVQAAAAGWADLRGREYDAGELERVARLQRRANAARAGMRDFLTAVALQSETDRYDERVDRVALMSLHAAKGLEFPVVFIVGCEEGLLPYLPPNRTADPAEERRLFYVGMTRARQRLILTHAARRLLFGQSMENRLSGFVTDIETALRELRQAPRRPPRPKTDDLQLPLF